MTFTNAKTLAIVGSAPNGPVGLPIQLLPFTKDDGGFSQARLRGRHGNGAVRTLAIMIGWSYLRTQDVVAAASKKGLPYRHSRVQPAVINKVFADLQASHGWKVTWHPCMGIGTGCTMHLNAELPIGRVLCRLSGGQYAAVIDGVYRDSYDYGRLGTRCVYGYWLAASESPWAGLLSDESTPGPILSYQ